MKRFTLLLQALAIGIGVQTMGATEVSPYVVDFNTQIDTSDHAFKIASNWGHKVGVGTYTDSWGDSEDIYLTYSWNSTGSHDDSGYLHVPKAYASGASWGAGATIVDDIFITPLIKGDVTAMIRSSDQVGAYVYIYNMENSTTPGELLKTIHIPSDVYYVWTEQTLLTAEETGDEYKRYGMRLVYLDIDDFKATSADINPEPGLQIETFTPSDLQGTIYWNQQPDGRVKISYTLTVTNTGQVDLNPGDEGYSITVWEGNKKRDLFTVDIPVATAIGATSEPFEVTGYVETPSDLWSYSGSTMRFFLRENILSKSTQLCFNGYKAYEPKFVMRKAGTTTTYNYTDPIKYGLVSGEDQTMDLEIFNDGVAPLTIVSMSLPEGYTGLPEESSNFVIQPQGVVPFSVTLPVTTLTPGLYAGDLEIKYLDKDQTEKTFTLAVSATIVDPNAWIWDFGTTSNNYPEGSFADTGISTDYLSSTGYYLKGSGYNGNFIFPKMHITPGSSMSFDTARESTSSNSPYALKVYVSADRSAWGEPIMELTITESNTNFRTVSVDFGDIEEGDYYVKFEIKNGRVDNICGPALVETPYDLYIKELSASPSSPQSGQEVSVTVKAIGTVGLAAGDYTIEYRTADEVLCTLESKDITANAKNEISFTAKIAPEVEETKTLDTYVLVTFADGSTVKSETVQLTVTNQPDFVFNNPNISDSQWSKPTSMTSAIKFGTVNEVGISKDFEIFNWGSAPLTVSSISVPEGFTVTPESAVVGRKEHLPVTISFSAEEPGTYKGELVINYTELDGEKEFRLEISGKMLDPNKWYVEFVQGSSSNQPVWPAGTIHGKNISGTNKGTNSEPIYAITSGSTTDNMLISPKMQVEEGDILQIEAMLYNSSWPEGVVEVVTAETREGLESEDTRTRVALLSGNNAERTHTVTKDWGTYDVEFPESGEFYIGFIFKANLYVHSLYGLHKIDVTNDIKMTASAPETVMQNSVANMSVNLQNFAPVVVAADDYSVAAIIDGVKALETNGSDITMATSYSDAPTTIELPVRMPKVGTSSVYFQYVSGDYVVTTEPVEITVTPEVFSAEVQVGEVSNANNYDAPLYLYCKNAESVMLYTADQLGLNNGDKISGLSFKGGFNPTSKTLTSTVTVAYAWVDETSLSKPANGSYDLSDMTILSQSSVSWINQGTPQSETGAVALISANLEEPMVYEAGKSLLIVVNSEDGTNWIQRGEYSWLSTSVTGQCYQHGNDTKSTYQTNSWTTVNLPVLFLSLAKDPVSVSGIVFDGEAPVDGAEITFVSNDGDNVQYFTTTDEMGTYSVDLIQNQRSYDIFVVSGAKEDFMLNQSFEATADMVNFSLMDVVTISNIDGEMHSETPAALVKLTLAMEEGMNTVVLPFDLTAEEVNELFGEDAEVAEFTHSELSNGALTVYFAHNGVLSDGDTGMIAGKPYLLNVTSAPAIVSYKGKDVTEALNHSTDPDGNVQFCGTYTAMPVEEGMFVLNNDNFVAAAKTRSAAGVGAYSAYVKALKPEVQNVSFTIDDQKTTGVSEIEIDQINDNDVIYNLQGIRVSNPTKGIYIVNGAKVLVK